MIEENSGGDVIADDEQENLVEGVEQPSGDVNAEQPKEQDNFYKNKAFELERKYNNTATELAEIKRLLTEKQSKPEETSQYTEDQLMAALSNPDTLTAEQQAFARSELRKIQTKTQEERDNRLIQEMEKRSKAEMTRKESEQQVLNDPRFQEAFIKLPNGTVQWKQDNVLAQTIGAYMQDPRLSSSPDALMVAAKLAYADISAGQAHQQLGKVTRENEKLKGVTMVEGGGRQYSKPSEDPFDQSMNHLRKSPGYDRKAGKDAVRAFLQKRDAVKK